MAKTPRPEYGIIVDGAIDAVYMRDLCSKEASRLADRGDATTGKAQERNYTKAAVFKKYAERFEGIRKSEADRIVANMRGASDGTP